MPGVLRGIKDELSWIDRFDFHDLKIVESPVLRI